MENIQTKLKEELILLYASLATKNLHKNRTNEPTEEMKKISTQLNLKHSEIILSAERLTRPKIN